MKNVKENKLCLKGIIVIEGDRSLDKDELINPCVLYRGISTVNYAEKEKVKFMRY